MATQFEDLLSIVCPGFDLKHATDFQKNYMVPDEKAARLAFDILVSYGFDAKVYPDDDNNNAAKLYITLPTADMDPAHIEQRLLCAIAYGKALSDIKLRMDALCRDDAGLLQSPSYTITFANSGSQSTKQIVIGVSNAAAQQQPAANFAPAPSQRTAAQPAQASAQVARKPVKKKAEDDGFNQGPTVAKNFYSGSSKKDGKSEDDFRRRAFLFITGNIATGGAGMMGALVMLFIAFSFFVLAKGFLCPDFAVEKKNQNRAWYCDSPTKQEEDPNKPKLPEFPEMQNGGNIR